MCQNVANDSNPCCKTLRLSELLPGVIRTNYSLRSWRYCVGARLKFWRRSRDPKKGVGTLRYEGIPFSFFRYWKGFRKSVISVSSEHG